MFIQTYPCQGSLQERLSADLCATRTLLSNDSCWISLHWHGGGLGIFSLAHRSVNILGICSNKKNVCSFLGLEERVWWWLREGKGKGLWEKDQKLQSKQQIRGESHEIKIEKWFTREKTQVRGKTAEWLRRRRIRHRGKERRTGTASWSSAWKESMREAIQSSVTLDERALQISASPLHLWESSSLSSRSQGPQTVILHNSMMRNARPSFWYFPSDDWPWFGPFYGF